MPSTPIPKPKLSKASRKNKSERSNVDNTNNDKIIGSLMESAPNMRQAAMPTSPSNALPGPDSPLIGPLSDLRAPATLLSAALPANLVEDGHSFSGGLFDDNDLNTMVASRPRTLWTIQDTALRSIPKNYPPLNRNCTAYVGDASPSVVAVRVAECLRKRSIAVEYDDESVTATCLTVDRCQFQIQLWKGNVTETADFSHGVVVECLRIHGSLHSFYPACRAILQAALGQSTGEDNRPLHQTNGLEFSRLPDPSLRPHASLDANKRLHVEKLSTARALEQVRELIRKDRLDTQNLGMERLINLTTPSICGKEICLLVSLQVLKDHPHWLLERIVLPVEGVDGQEEAKRNTLVDSSNSHTTFGAVVTPNEGRHESKMRAGALRVLANSLSNLSEAKLLDEVLQEESSRTRIVSKKPDGNSSDNRIDSERQQHPLLGKDLLHSLVTDLKGVNRPHSVVQAGAALASVHEAALAVRILRILGEHAPEVKEFSQSEMVLERLELARSCGRATHLVLQQEAELSYATLTEDVRSC